MALHERARGNRHKLKHRKFHLDVIKKLFYWKSGGTLEQVAQRVFFPENVQNWTGEVLRNLLCSALLWQGVGWTVSIDNFKSNHTVIMWFWLFARLFFPNWFSNWVGDSRKGLTQQLPKIHLILSRAWLCHKRKLNVLSKVSKAQH